VGIFAGIGLYILNRFMEYIVLSPHRKAFRIKQENLHLVKKVKGWRVQRNQAFSMYYNQKTGKINGKYSGVKELKSQKDIEAIGATYENEFELLFGRLKEITK